MKDDIRILQAEDIKAVKELSKLIWDGDDYLGRVAKSWIEEGGFLGMFEGDQLIGTAKLTRLPDKVLWLEGLRIHPDYAGHGLGKKLSGMALEAALNQVAAGEADYIEFSTYYKNEASIHLATQAGFKQVDEFYLLTHRSIKPTAPKFHTRVHDDAVGYFPNFVPYGWKFLHPVKQSLNWLNKKVTALKAAEGYFYVGGESPVICLLTPAGDWLHEAMPLAQHILGKKEELQVMLHSSRKAEIDTLLQLGFHWWEEDSEDRVLVYRYQPE